MTEIRDMPIKILIADDHAQFRETLRNLLSFKFEGEYVVIGEAANGEETLKLVPTHNPDILLLDHHLPGLGRLADFCGELSRRSPSTKILILSGSSEEESAREAGLAGAKGYIVKGASATNLGRAIRAVQAGGVWIDRCFPIGVIDSFLRQTPG